MVCGALADRYWAARGDSYDEIEPATAPLVPVLERFRYRNLQLWSLSWCLAASPVDRTGFPSVCRIVNGK